MEITTLALLALTPVLVWRIYSRLKGMLTRQRSIVARHYTGAGVFAAMVLVAASELGAEPALLAWLALGTAFGIGWGVWGVRRTRFEVQQDGCYFTPHLRLGMVIALQFAACILYVGFAIFANQGSGAPTPRLTDYPFSMPSLGLMAGYFGTYSAGLIRWRHALRKAARAN